MLLLVKAHRYKWFIWAIKWISLVCILIKLLNIKGGKPKVREISFLVCLKLLPHKKSVFFCPENEKTDVLDSKVTSAPASKPWNLAASFCVSGQLESTRPSCARLDTLARAARHHPSTWIVHFEARCNDSTSNEATQGREWFISEQKCIFNWAAHGCEILGELNWW